MTNLFSLRHVALANTGADAGGGGSGSPSFGGSPNFKKWGKTSHAYAQIHHVLVLNSYPDLSIVHRIDNRHEVPFNLFDADILIYI